MRLVAVSAPLFALLLGCAGSRPVQRVNDGQVREGRFISHQSYAAYARAAALEAAGKLSQAEAAYTEALESDPQSPEIWIRIGSVRCKRSAPFAGEAFDHAEALAHNTAALWQARAECALKEGKTDAALTAARRALALDPERPENTQLVCNALLRAGKTGEARRHLDAFLVANPGFAPASRWLAELFGSPQTDDARAREALSKLDELLLAQDFSKAMRHAQDLGLGYSELTARALALGQRAWARERADLALAANPHDIDARVLALVAADLELDSEKFREHLVLSEPNPPGTLGLSYWLFAELLTRRVGAEAARAWMKDAARPESDALLERVAERVTSRLAEPAAPPQATPAKARKNAPLE